MISANGDFNLALVIEIDSSQNTRHFMSRLNKYNSMEGSTVSLDKGAIKYGDKIWGGLIFA